MTQRGRNIQRGTQWGDGDIRVPAGWNPLDRQREEGTRRQLGPAGGTMWTAPTVGVSGDSSQLVSPHVPFDFSPYKLPFDLRKPRGLEPAEPRSPHHLAFTSASASICSPPSSGRQNLAHVILG